MNIQLEIPDDVARIISSRQPDLSRAAIEALALEGYRERTLSESQIRRMLGFDIRVQVHAFLKAHGVPLNYSIADLDHDVKSLAEFEEKLPS